jgi:type III secretion protein D
MNPSNNLAAASPGWCLRFLSGAVRGRTISLSPGINVVGSAADCQIMLPASDVQPRHLIFSAGAVALSVVCVATADARINGDALATARRSVVVGDVLSIGKIDFQIERSYPASEHTNEPADSMFLEADAPLSAAAAAPPRSRARGWAMAATVWVLTMGLIWWGLSDNVSQAGQAGAQVNIAELEAALKDFAETEVLAGPSGHMSIRGFVESQPRKQALQLAMQPFGSRVTVSVHSVDELIDEARRFVGDPGVAITYAGKGRLVVSGKSDSADVREKIQRLGEGLQPAVLVSDKVQYREKPQDNAGVGQRNQWADWQRELPARMVSVTEDRGGMRYIQLANGNVLFEGSVLKSGAELKSLRLEGAVDVPRDAP